MSKRKQKQDSTRKPRAEPRLTIKNLVAAMERIAPSGLAQKWDNVGLLAGDLHAPLRRILLCIDLTAPVVSEARDAGAEAVLAYHPPIFKPISALRLPSTDPAGLVLDCIRSGIAIYSPHTALDAADGGTNDVLAELCGIKRTEPLEYVPRPGIQKCKLIVFVPPEHAEKVAEAIFLAGAGHIGNYSQCSFRVPGEGTFFGGETAKPAIGQRGRLERVAEIRLESIVDKNLLPAVIERLRRSHPYEEPAFDIYPLDAEPARGIGRVGTLSRAQPLGTLARKLSRATAAKNIQLVGGPEREVDRAVIVAGSAGTLPFQVDLTPRDVIITGEIRHHDALTMHRRGCTAIALGHWASERPVLVSLAQRLSEMLSNIECTVSSADGAPIRGLR